MSPKPTIAKGDVFKTNNCGKCKVIKYVSAKKVYVKFLQYHEKFIVTSARSLRKGKVENPYKPTAYGIGYMGKGKFSSANKKAYGLWIEMLRRCYSEEYKEKFPTYIGCTVVKSWLNFQTFCKWVIHQPNYDAKGFCLDKDLRVFGNKKYGPKYCSFVPNKVNVIFSGTKVGKSKYPGVWYHKQCKNPYWVLCNKKSYRFGNPKKAYKFSLKLKLARIKETINEHKHNLHPDIYNNLTNLDLKSLSKLLFMFYKERRIS